MTAARRIAPILLAVVAVAGPLAACVPTPAPAKTTKPTTAAPAAAKCTVLPANNVWHADVSKLPVNAHSTAWLASTGAASRKLHPDFGGPYGIPVTTVAGSHAKVPVTFEWPNESDRVLYPLGSDTQIEPGGGDSHAILLDNDNCKLYETYATAKTSQGWTAGSGAVYDLRSNALRPNGYTSADGAGLPILPGLLRYDEVESGEVDHAVRFTVSRSDASHLWPARHDAGSANVNLPPMGARFRLKANYSLTGLRPDTIAVLTAFKKYGLIVADNGSDWFFTGARDSRWPDALLDQLKQVPASAFEAIDESSLQASANSGQVRGK
jgi:hypothetical protein